MKVIECHICFSDYLKIYHNEPFNYRLLPKLSKWFNFWKINNDFGPLPSSIRDWMQTCSKFSSACCHWNMVSIVRHSICLLFSFSREHGAVFAAFSGITGTALLYWGVNPLTSIIGAANYFIYTAAYTPMKRITPLNTWVGSVVGALPPVMGWTAATDYIGLGNIY